MKDIIAAVTTLSGLGMIFGLLLGWFSKIFRVAADPLVEKINNLLPGINCGACGMAGCSTLAEALAAGEADVNACVVCSAENKQKIAGLLGKSLEEVEVSPAQLAVVGCGGGTRSKNKFTYHGLYDCRAAQLVLGGPTQCQYACLGAGTCVDACPFGAIKMQEDGIPKISPELCRGCRKCVAVCPRNIIFMVNRREKVYVRCKSGDKGPQVMKACSVGCIACGKCAAICPVQAITISNNLARIDYTKCVSCKKCVEVCPTHAIALL